MTYCDICSCKVAVVITKMHLVSTDTEKQLVVDIESWAKTVGARTFSTSAKNGVGAPDVLHCLRLNCDRSVPSAVDEVAATPMETPSQLATVMDSSGTESTDERHLALQILRLENVIAGLQHELEELKAENQELEKKRERIGAQCARLDWQTQRLIDANKQLAEELKVLEEKKEEQKCTFAVRCHQRWNAVHNSLESQLKVLANTALKRMVDLQENHLAERSQYFHHIDVLMKRIAEISKEKMILMKEHQSAISRAEQEVLQLQNANNELESQRQVLEVAARERNVDLQENHLAERSQYFRHIDVLMKCIEQLSNEKMVLVNEHQSAICTMEREVQQMKTDRQFSSPSYERAIWENRVKMLENKNASLQKRFDNYKLDVEFPRRNVRPQDDPVKRHRLSFY